jgi:hypothetical protein
MVEVYDTEVEMFNILDSKWATKKN